MSNRIFLEVVFVAKDFVHSGRDEVENALKKALEVSGLGGGDRWGQWNGKGHSRT